MQIDTVNPALLIRPTQPTFLNLPKADAGAKHRRSVVRILEVGPSYSLKHRRFNIDKARPNKRFLHCCT